MEQLEPVYSALQMDDITDQFDPAEMKEKQALVIILSVFFFVFFLPLVNPKFKTDYLNKVSNQSLTMLAIAALAWLVSKIIPLVGWLISDALFLLVAAVMVSRVMDAANGKIREVPFGKLITINLCK